MTKEYSLSHRAEIGTRILNTLKILANVAIIGAVYLVRRFSMLVRVS